MRDNFDALYIDIVKEFKSKINESYIILILVFIHRMREERVKRGYDGSSAWIEQRIKTLKESGLNPAAPLIEHAVKKHEKRILELLKHDNKNNQKTDLVYHLFSEKSWVQPLGVRSPLSGWKLHIYGINVIDTLRINYTLAKFLEKKDLPYKLTTHVTHQSHMHTVQEGKAFTIYLPIKYFLTKKKRNELKSVIDEISKLLHDAGYSRKGEISGDRRWWNGIIHYRYDRTIWMRSEGFDEKEYYNPNEGGDYNIERNPDLFEMLKT